MQKDEFELVDYRLDQFDQYSKKFWFNLILIHNLPQYWHDQQLYFLIKTEFLEWLDLKWYAAMYDLRTSQR